MHGANVSCIEACMWVYVSVFGTWILFSNKSDPQQSNSQLITKPLTLIHTQTKLWTCQRSYILNKNMQFVNKITYRRARHAWPSGRACRSRGLMVFDCGCNNATRLKQFCLISQGNIITQYNVCLTLWPQKGTRAACVSGQVTSCAGSTTSNFKRMSILYWSQWCITLICMQDTFARARTRPKG